MPTHVFVDESKAKGLLMAAAHCQAGDVAVHRKALRNFLLPGQERLHFNNERPARRKQILALITSFSLMVDLYVADRPTLANRQRCLEAIVRDCAGQAERLVTEMDEPLYDSDLRILRQAAHRYGCHETLRWSILVAKADPLLWVPDAVAWCWTRGGDWKKAVAPFCQLREL